MSEYSLQADEEFRKLMLSKRARLLAEVDECEEFLDMERTKEIREAVKQAKRGNVDGLASLGVQFITCNINKYL